MSALDQPGFDAALQRAFAPARFVFCSLSAKPVRAVRPLRFAVSVTRPDGTTRNYERLGGSSCDHIVEALDEAGHGGAVRVLPMRELELA